MTKNSENNQGGGSKINQNMMIAIIGAVTTILAAVIPWALNKFEAQPLPTPTPIIVTATLESKNPTPSPSAESATPVPTNSHTSPTSTPTADAQTGIFDVYLAYDDKGEFRSTSFSPTQNVILFFSLNDPLKRNIVKVIWIASEVKGFQPNIVIDKTENKITTSPFSMRTNRETWDVGKYKIELYLNGTLDETIEFEIAN